MVKSRLEPDGNGIVGGDIWLSGMRQAGLSEQEISRVVSVTATLAESGNGHGELVPVKEAARRIDRSENTLRSWIRLGHLVPVEKTPPVDNANGPWIHVDMADVEELDRGNNPPEQHEGDLITLREAAERFGVKLSRVQGWVYRDLLPVRNKREKTGRTGGILLVAHDDVATLVANPPRPTGRRRSENTL